MPYLNCSRCGLSLGVRFAVLEPANCPRCLARNRVLQPLFRSSLTVQELQGDDGKPSEGNPSWR